MDQVCDRFQLPAEPVPYQDDPAHIALVERAQQRMQAIMGKGGLEDCPLLTLLSDLEQISELGLVLPSKVAEIEAAFGAFEELAAQLNLMTQAVEHGQRLVEGVSETPTLRHVSYPGAYR